MKKRWKVFWVLCICLGVLGIALCISGSLLGATMETVRSTFGIGNHGMRPYIWAGGSYDRHDVAVDEMEDLEDLEDLEDSGSYEGQRFSDIRKVKIDVTCLEVAISEGDDSQIVVDTGGLEPEILKDLVISQDHEELKAELKNSRKWENLVSGYESRGTLSIRLPRNQEYEEVKVKVGTGILTADQIRAEELEIEVGAGQVYLDSFTAEELELECGAGEANLYGDARKKVKIECGVGTVNYSAVGSQGDYNYEVECGIGSVTVGGETYSGLGSEHKIHNGGSRKMEIECGIGMVDVSFGG